MAPQPSSFDIRLANGTRTLARVRQHLDSMAHAGVLLKIDCYLYEIARRELIQIGQGLQQRGRLAAQLYFPAPLAAVTCNLAQSGMPSPTVLVPMTQFVARQRRIRASQSFADPVIYALCRLEDQIQFMAKYVLEREYDCGLAVPPTQQAITALNGFLQSPQMLRILSLGTSLVLGTVAMASTTVPRQDHTKVWRQGLAIAKEFMMAMQPEVAAPPVVEATVVQTETVPPTAAPPPRPVERCAKEDPNCKEEQFVEVEAKEATAP